MTEPRLCSMTATEMVKFVGKGDITRRELVEAHLARIEEHNGAINAIVEVRDKAALAEATAADRDAANRAGLALDGVPICIKDHFDVAGMKRTEGVRAMAGRVSTADELVVARLRAAGAIIVAKCNQPDFQIRWNTVSELYGATRNPRDLTRSAGGSSGGDAAAVASGMAALGLGADYGGSIRVPAAFCGIYGLRPSAGRVPAVPISPPFDGPPTLDLMFSIGPFARSASDLWRAFEVLSGADPRDPATIDMPLHKSSGDTSRRVARMCRQTGAPVSQEIEAALDDTADILREAGYEIVDAGIPSAERAPEVWAELVSTELIRSAMPVWRDQIGASGRQHIEEMFGIYDLGQDVGRYFASFMERRAIVRETAVWMENHPLILAPVAATSAPPLDFDLYLDRQESQLLFDSMRSLPWVNLLSLPSVALPNGVQIVARRFYETDIFHAALAVERAIGPLSIVVADGDPAE